MWATVRDTRSRKGKGVEVRISVVLSIAGVVCKQGKHMAFAVVFQAHSVILPVLLVKVDM